MFERWKIYLNRRVSFCVKILDRLFERIQKLFAIISFFIGKENRAVFIFERWKIYLNRRVPFCVKILGRLLEGNLKIVYNCFVF